MCVAMYMYWWIYDSVYVGCKFDMYRGFVEVASITMDGIYHVAFAICNDDWVLGSYVVQELFQSCHGGYHGFRLLQ